MKKLVALSLLLFVLLPGLIAVPVVFAAENANGDADVQEYVFELTVNQDAGRSGNSAGQGAVLQVIPPGDNSMSNPDYKLLPFHWFKTANYYVNPANPAGLAVVDTVKASAITWDVKTSSTVFSYVTTTSRVAGSYDGFNVVSWGSYSSANAIAVTFLWARGKRVLETDTVMNIAFTWSLSAESGKMDVQNIMTHEFGHWCGLNDLYSNTDYYLTMYGIAGYGETWKQTLGLGDILGLQAVYGP